MDNTDQGKLAGTKTKSSSDERAFLHDLASPLCTALLLVDTLSEQLNLEGTLQKEPDLEMLQKIMEALTKVNALLKQRRQTLIDRGL